MPSSGKTSSQSFLAGLLLCGIMMPGAALAAEKISGAEIKQQMRELLAAKGLNTAPDLADNRMFRACSVPLTIKAMFGSFKTMQVVCPDQDGYKIAVRTNISPNGNSNINPDLSARVSGNKPAQNNVPLLGDVNKLVTLARSVRRGEILASDDLAYAPTTGRGVSGYFEQIDDVIGRKMRRNLTVNQVVLNRHLELDWDIIKDQSVIIESQMGAIRVASAGIAIQDGQIGDLLRAKNLSSGRIVEGIAISGKKIRIKTK